MFRPGRILQFGGNSQRRHRHRHQRRHAGRHADAVDVVAAPPRQRRRSCADGKVLATGGSPVWNELTGVNNSAEIWNPQTGQWTRGAVGARARLYHSIALLLPDASVLVAGGGAPGPAEQHQRRDLLPAVPVHGRRAACAARRAITLAPTALTIGKTFSVDVGNAERRSAASRWSRPARSRTAGTWSSASST